MQWQELTPAELLMMQRAEAARRERENEAQNMRDYTLACMISGFMWAKRRPSYDELFHPKNTAQDGGMTDEEMLEQVRALNKLFGGSEEGF